MQKLRGIFVLLLIPIFLSCSTVPLTGRQQLSLIPSNDLLSMSFRSYDDFLSKHKIITGTDEAFMVERVGRNIQFAIEKYFKDNYIAGRLHGYKWEFNLVEGEEANAWCMPGGKVVVYTGILPYAGDDAGLAVVMGHEIAHAVANHGDERMSQGLLSLMGGIALAVALSEKPGETNRLFLAAFGLGTTIGVLLPYTRLHESEADRLGLIFMAMAGYDPHEAVGFWERMSASKKGASLPEFLSTHPADENRIADIEKSIPEAMTYLKKI